MGGRLPDRMTVAKPLPREGHVLLNSRWPRSCDRSEARPTTARSAPQPPATAAVLGLSRRYFIRHLGTPPWRTRRAVSTWHRHRGML